MDAKTAHVLIVDDDCAIQRFLTTLLARAGYECEIVPDGAQALLRIVDGPPRIVLLDLMMPKVNGFEVLAELRSRKPDRLGDVIVMSAASSRVLDQLAAYRDEIGRLIRKPFDIDELLGAVEDCAQRGRTEPRDC